MPLGAGSGFHRRRGLRESKTALLARYGTRLGHYLGVGIICAAAYNAIMIAGGLIHAFYALSFAIAYLVVTPLGYMLHVRFTFATQANWRGLLRYAGANLTGVFISFGLTAMSISGFGFSPVVAAPAVTILLFFWNFIATHWALRTLPPNLLWNAGTMVSRLGARFAETRMAQGLTYRRLGPAPIDERPTT